ncbi:hypothetical protein [Isoptericola halotolerans]|uniref:Uncharacterized protein n=1 Tax=Isoptericola halotolerans TaxID=300560 RepID=A0ABX2A5Q8_9MICO|nr:hypothetical protein [Isoptericola halotolerans]NOV98119.1 hypothetical protein [Isoptericola halotolerans]
MSEVEQVRCATTSGTPGPHGSDLRQKSVIDLLPRRFTEGTGASPLATGTDGGLASDRLAIGLGDPRHTRRTGWTKAARSGVVFRSALRGRTGLDPDASA